jgi:gamma-glutamylputrescine oxidase
MINTDVVVIGGGFTGISTSYHLQEKGINTVVLEEHSVGWGASGRNGGMLNTGYKLSAGELIKKFGLEEAKRLDQYALDCNEAVRGIAEKHQIDCDIKQCGHIGLSRKESKMNAFKRSQEIIAKHFNREVKVLTGPAIQEEIASDYFKSAYLDPLSYHFHPLNYVCGMAKVATENGAQIYEQSKAIAIKKSKGKFSVETPKGVVHADHLVYATDGYSGKITKELHKGIFPLASFIIATESLPESLLGQLIPKDRNLYDTINLTNYFRRTPDNRVIFGGSGIGYPAKQKYKAELMHLLTNVFPQLKQVKIDHFWGGIIGATVEKFPVMGQTKEGAYYAVGYTGHGAAQSTLHGKMLSQMIAQEERINPIFEKTPLKTVPMYQQKKLLVSAANMYFRMMDRLN